MARGVEIGQIGAKLGRSRKWNGGGRTTVSILARVHYSRGVSDESPKPIVALRVVRPYDSEDQFLREEAFALTRTSLVLVGANPRPEGVILRFELVLRSGAILLRGEGRVLGHGPTELGEPGLTLKFTRLDPRSKALVDRAAAAKVAEAPAPSETPPVVRSAPASRPEEVPAYARATVPNLRAVRIPVKEPVDEGPEVLRAEVVAPEPSEPEIEVGPPSVAPVERTSAPVPPPPPTSSAIVASERDAALERLRARLRGRV